MATYRTIATSETNPQAPVTSALMKALDANPTAIAEGASGAPRVDGRALGGVCLGSLTLSSISWAAVTDLDRVGFVRLGLAIDFGTNAVISVQYSNDNGGSWGSTQQITGLSVGAAGFLAGDATINLQTGVTRAIGTHSTNGPVSASHTHTVPSNCNAVRFQVSANSGYAMVYVLGGLE